MATTPNKKKVKKSGKQPNYMMWVIIGILIIPCIILFSILMQAFEDTGTPIIGNRFDDALDPEISDDLLEKIENIKIDGCEISVNLATATLRISVDCPDTATREQVEAYMNDAYNKVIAIVPAETYFTNKKDVRMYDLEVHAFNTNDENSTIVFIHLAKIKTGAQEGAAITDFTTAKNPETSDGLLKK